MPKTVRDQQIVIRIAAELRSELEREAAEERRKLADHVRQLLIDYAAERATERQAAA